MEPIKDTVPKQSEDYEVDGRPHAVLHASLGPDPIVHHLIPVLTGQNLQTNTQPQSTTGQILTKICLKNTRHQHTLDVYT